MVIDHVSLVKKPDSSSTERLLARQICVAGTGNFDRRKSNNHVVRKVHENIRFSSAKAEKKCKKRHKKCLIRQG